MKAGLLHEHEGRRTFAVVLETGDGPTGGDERGPGLKRRHYMDVT